MITLPLLLIAIVAAAEPSALTIDKSMINAGEVRANKPLVHTFRLKNNTTEEIEITQVVGVCGCVKPELKSRKLLAGAETELVVGVNLLTQPEGPGSWSSTIRYRTLGESAKAGEAQVRLTATVQKEVVVEPVSLFLSTENEISGKITVHDRRGKSLRIKSARLGIAGVKTFVKEPTETSGKSSQQIDVSVTQECKAGSHFDELCIDTDDPEYRELRIPIRIVKKSPDQGVSALPAQPMVRFARDQAQGSALIRLRDAADHEVAIDRIEADHEAISWKWAAGPGTSTTLRILIDRSKTKLSESGIVTVRLKSPKEETLFLPIAWTIPEPIK